MPRPRTTELTPEQARAIAHDCYADVLAYCKRHASAGVEAQDLAQDVFLRFARARTYVDRGKPIAYLLRIARNVCVEAARAPRMHTVPLDFDVAEDVPPAQNDALAEALSHLTAAQQEALELRYGAGLGVSEVAHVLGISRFAVRRLLNAALATVGRELESGEEL